MTITFVDVQNRINQDYLNRTDFTNETKRAIIRAIKHYERERFWFNQTATALTCSTATISLALPVDFIALDQVTVKTVTAGVTSQPVVVQRPMDRILYQNIGGTSGAPQECALYRGSLNFYPLPDSAYPVTVYYTHQLTQLSADTDTNDWLSAAEDLVVFHAAADMLQNVIRGDPNTVAGMRDMESTALASLQRYRKIRLDQGEDIAIIGPLGRQAPIKTDAGNAGGA